MIEPFDGLGIKVDRSKVRSPRNVYIAYQHTFLPGRFMVRVFSRTNIAFIS